MTPIPEFSLPFPDKSDKWDQTCHLFTHNDAPEEEDAPTLRWLETDRKMHVANISVIDTRMEMLAAQLRDLESKKQELAQRVTLMDSVFHIIRRLPDDVLTEIFLACCPSPPYTGEGFFSDGLEPADWSDSGLDTKRAPWVLTRVCRRWRSLAIHSPALWAVVAVDSDDFDEVDFDAPAKTLRVLSLLSERARSHRFALSLYFETEIELPLRSAFRSPPSLFSHCTQLQIATTGKMLCGLREFISSLIWLSFLSLDLLVDVVGQTQPESLVLCHESVRLSALRLTEPSHLSLFHFDVSHLVSIHLSGIILDAAYMLILQQLSTQAPKLEVLSLSDARSPFIRTHRAPSLLHEESSISFPRVRTLALIQSGESYRREEEHGLEPITALLFILRLPSLQSFRFQIGIHIYSDDCWAPFSRKMHPLLPAATHTHIILRRGYNDLIVDLFTALPHITSVVLEPYVLSDIHALFSNMLPVLTRLEIRTGKLRLGGGALLGHLVNMLSGRRASGLSLPHVIVDAPVDLPSSEADELLERWDALCRAGMDGRDVVFRA